MTFEGYAKKAGFENVEVLPIEHDFLRCCRLDRERYRLGERPRLGVADSWTQQNWDAL